MHLRVLGCHGGETPHHRTSSFLLDGVFGIDAGAVTSQLALDEQSSLKAVAVSHAHFDHVKDLATLADNRCQSAEHPLLVAGTRATIRALRTHFFNNVLWPDFSTIPLVRTGKPTIEFVELQLDHVTDIEGYSVHAVEVNHTIETSGFVISRGGRSVAYSGDTGPTDRFWEAIRSTPDVAAVLQEVSFPNRLSWLAERSGHLTPELLLKEIAKLEGRRLAMLMYHIKPCFQGEVEAELAATCNDDLDVLALGDELLL